MQIPGPAASGTEQLAFEQLAFEQFASKQFAPEQFALEQFAPEQFARGFSPLQNVCLLAKAFRVSIQPASASRSLDTASVLKAFKSLNSAYIQVALEPMIVETWDQTIRMAMPIKCDCVDMVTERIIQIKRAD